MNRRSFMAGLTGLPIVGLGAGILASTVTPLITIPAEKGKMTVLPAGYDIVQMKVGCK